MSLIGLINSDNFDKNCERNITHPINVLIPYAVIGIGKLEIVLILEQRGVIMGRPFLLDSINPIYLTLDLKICILFIVNNRPKSLNLYRRHFKTLL